MTTMVTPRIILGPEFAGIFLTPEEFDGIDEADRDYRYELINGSVFRKSVPLSA
jgi:hypothetical protein